jgi:hypothetical protein
MKIIDRVWITYQVPSLIGVIDHLRSCPTAIGVVRKRKVAAKLFTYIPPLGAGPKINHPMVIDLMTNLLV